jgi:hypothetical protein
MFTRRRFGLIIAYGSVIYFCYNLFIRRLDAQLGDEEFEEVTGEEEEEESLFIPLTFPTPLPQQFYARSDPDWQEFIKLSKDSKRQKAVRDELAEKVLRDIQKHPKTQQLLGKNIKLTKHWFELKFPDAPPPDYSRQGIEIADEYVALSTQVLPSAHYQQLANIFMPKAAALAAWSGLKMFATCQVVKFKAVLGVELNKQEKQVAMLMTAVKQMSDQIDAGGVPQDPSKGIQQLQSQSQAIDQLLGTKPKTSTSTPAASQPRPARDQTPPSSSASIPLPTIVSPNVWARLNATLNPFSSSQSPATQSTATTTKTPSSATPSASTDTPSFQFKVSPSPSLLLTMATFQTSLAQLWQQSHTDPQPKGAFFVFGEMEVKGEKARAKCEVKAAYDPKERKYVWVQANVKHAWELKQRAKGGP